ncbi:cytidylate kinase [Actinacidiphila yanglinensis]|uniref:(d)CMP kinase n=1 Tax=Actinacidiphila yanglinensis TaxID=310779 RepID=A0A1H6E968_9ACTN|nr:(d)CMP kinase [Actinacidiphila yanglinensis]SEG94242.1 cytidylate kinase [Actinacidiphila yanglinensis]
MTGRHVVTLDGPNGVGKTAVARELARTLGCAWLSIGMVYRALAASAACPDSPLELRWQKAPDGALDPVVEVAGTAFRETDLTAEPLGSAASRIGADPAWQHKVNRVLRAAAADRPVVAEGRAGQEIFPDPLLSVFLWADAGERAARAAAVSGVPHDPRRERRDRTRVAEPLRVRSGCLVWNSTRFTMDTTVAALARRVRTARGERDFTVAVTGLRGEHRTATVRCVPADRPADALLTVPPGGREEQRLALAEAHAPLLRHGSDIVSVGRVPGSREDALLDAVGWPANRRLTARWLLDHGHFAVPAEVLALAGPDWVTTTTALGRAGSDAPAALEALQGAWWLPVPAAAAHPPGTGGASAAAERAERDLETALRQRQSADAPAPPFDLDGCRDSRAALWLTAAAPDALTQFVLPQWEGGR